MKSFFLNKLFKSSVNRESFDELLIEIIDNVFRQKRELHNYYFLLCQKLWSSNRNNEKKVLISKYLIKRLLRQSNLILENSSRLASRLCSVYNNRRQTMPKSRKILH